MGEEKWPPEIQKMFDLEKIRRQQHVELTQELVYDLLELSSPELSKLVFDYVSSLISDIRWLWTLFYPKAPFTCDSFVTLLKEELQFSDEDCEGMTVSEISFVSNVLRRKFERRTKHQLPRREHHDKFRDIESIFELLADYRLEFEPDEIERFNDLRDEVDHIVVQNRLLQPLFNWPEATEKKAESASIVAPLDDESQNADVPSNNNYQDRLIELRALRAMYDEGTIDKAIEKRAKNWLGRDWDKKAVYGDQKKWREWFNQAEQQELVELKSYFEQKWKSKSHKNRHKTQHKKKSL